MQNISEFAWSAYEAELEKLANRVEQARSLATATGRFLHRGARRARHLTQTTGGLTPMPNPRALRGGTQMMEVGQLQQAASQGRQAAAERAAQGVVRHRPTRAAQQHLGHQAGSAKVDPDATRAYSVFSGSARRAGERAAAPPTTRRTLSPAREKEIMHPFEKTEVGASRRGGQAVAERVRKQRSEAVRSEWERDSARKLDEMSALAKKQQGAQRMQDRFKAQEPTRVFRAKRTSRGTVDAPVPGKVGTKPSQDSALTQRYSFGEEGAIKARGKPGITEDRMRELRQDARRQHSERTRPFSANFVADSGAAPTGPRVTPPSDNATQAHLLPPTRSAPPKPNSAPPKSNSPQPEAAKPRFWRNAALAAGGTTIAAGSTVGGYHLARRGKTKQRERVLRAYRRYS